MRPGHDGGYFNSFIPKSSFFLHNFWTTQHLVWVCACIAKCTSSTKATPPLSAAWGWEERKGEKKKGEDFDMFSVFSCTVRRPLQLGNFAVESVRGATKKAGGTAKNNRDSAGRRLGVKKFGGHKVEPGNIIIRQRGTRYHVGENVGLGRDHTLYSLKAGRVHFNFDRQKKR